MLLFFLCLKLLDTLYSHSLEKKKLILYHKINNEYENNLTLFLTFFFVLFFPIIMAVFFGTIFGGFGSENREQRLPILVVDEDSTSESRAFTASLESAPEFEVTIASRQQAATSWHSSSAEAASPRAWLLAPLPRRVGSSTGWPKLAR